ncbi:molybdenum cofactor guanylyltransferase [Coprothermobacteraceae bacterium]|nr:molybdenum cofactor guanylyltransferase [Coprothermobacteraceae bacterium]
MDLGVAILCGDESRRMGVRKALLKVGGVPLWQVVSDQLTGPSYPVCVVSKLPIPGCQCILDKYEVDSPLSGILTAFASLPHQRFVFVPVDMPLVGLSLVEELARAAQEGVSVFLHCLGSIQPFPCLIDRSAFPDLLRYHQEGNFRLTKIFTSLPHITIGKSCEDRALFNINTWDDWHRFLCISGGTWG